MLFCSLAFMLLNLFKARASFCLTRCSISLAEHLKCVCTQVTIKVDVFIQKNMYPIQNYVQISMVNHLFQELLVSFLSKVLSRMLQFSCGLREDYIYKIMSFRTIHARNEITKHFTMWIKRKHKCKSFWKFFRKNKFPQSPKRTKKYSSKYTGYGSVINIVQNFEHV